MLAEVIRQAEAITYERGFRPEMLWLGRQAEMEVYRLSATDRMDSWVSFTAEPVLFGMQLNGDNYLPPDVWRLADRYGTLLYDCREGKFVA